jgi:hypothetical protein
MPKRSSILQLPEDTQAELNKRLVKNGFADYQGLADWLAEKGFQISKSSIHRHGQQFEERLAAIKVATEQAKAITAAVGDEEGAMNEALIRLVQERAFEVLVNLQTDDPKQFAKVFPKMGMMVARLGRASVQQKKWRAEVKGKAKVAANEVGKIVKSSGLSTDKAREIREKILGVAA